MHPSALIKVLFLKVTAPSRFHPRRDHLENMLRHASDAKSITKSMSRYPVTLDGPNWPSLGITVSLSITLPRCSRQRCSGGEMRSIPSRSARPDRVPPGGQNDLQTWYVCCPSLQIHAEALFQASPRLIGLHMSQLRSSMPCLIRTQPRTSGALAQACSDLS